jgi:hypothetical protein
MSYQLKYKNAYLTAPISEKYWVMAGDEFPLAYQGRPCKVVRALYGLPVAGFSFRSFLSKNLKELGIVPTKGDADIELLARHLPKAGTHSVARRARA